jgi:DNA invertase Pin-like site-specific DNA recombinase
LERLALQALLGDIRARKIDVVVVYKVDRLTRSLADFAKLVELFEAHGVSFVSVTQQLIGSSSATRELKSRLRVTQSIMPIAKRPSGLLFLLPARARASR